MTVYIEGKDKKGMHKNFIGNIPCIYLKNFKELFEISVHEDKFNRDNFTQYFPKL